MKGIITKEEADKIAVAFSPKKFPATISPTAQTFVALNSQQESSFKLDKLVAQQTGIAELERLSIEERVEKEALLRLKDLQEEAYKQAHQLGLDEGREKAFLEHQTELSEKIAHFEELIGKLERLKVDLVANNETQILRLIYYMAKRLVLQEVSTKPELILEIVKQAVESAQSDEQVMVKLSPTDFAFIENAKQKLGKEFERVKQAKIEASEDVASGGCVVTTNFGVVNASIDQRLEKLWNAVSEKLPKVRDELKGE